MLPNSVGVVNLPAPVYVYIPSASPVPPRQVMASPVPPPSISRLSFQNPPRVTLVMPSQPSMTSCTSYRPMHMPQHVVLQQNNNASVPCSPPIPSKQIELRDLSLRMPTDPYRRAPEEILELVDDAMEHLLQVTGNLEQNFYGFRQTPSTQKKAIAAKEMASVSDDDRKDDE